MSPFANTFTYSNHDRHSGMRRKKGEKEKDMVWNFSPEHELNILDSNIWMAKKTANICFVCLYTILHGWIGDRLGCK